jgi:hypothetical protein
LFLSFSFLHNLNNFCQCRVKYGVAAKFIPEYRVNLQLYL